MKKSIAFILALATAIGTLFGCLSPATPADSVQTKDSRHTKTETADVKTLSYGIDLSSFDEKFIGFIDGRLENKSYMISPLSFRYALGLLLPGAVGETKAELMAALGTESEEEWEKVCIIFNGFAQQYNASVDAERQQFEQDTAKGYYPEGTVFSERGLNVANSVWKREDLPDFKQNYKDKISRLYDSEYKTFNCDNVIENVNTWASDKTKGLIPELLPKNYDISGLAIILMNALYFKDSWAKEFEKYATVKKDFTTFDGSTVSKDFMTQTSDYLYYSDENTQLVILPMKDGVYMTFVIGDTSDLGRKTASAERKTVKVTIPKIDLETSLTNKELCDFLVENGVSLAFSGSADFSDMTDCAVCIGDIIQKTKIKLNENGVEAAAVTAILMDECTAVEEFSEVIEFTADRPFSFYIYTTADTVTEMMFSGKIVD